MPAGFVGGSWVIRVSDTPYTPLERGAIESLGYEVIELTEDQAQNVEELRV